MDDNKKEFDVDFGGYVTIEAKNAEEAEELFWKIFWNGNNTSAFTRANIDIDSIEEAW